MSAEASGVLAGSAPRPAAGAIDYRFAAPGLGAPIAVRSDYAIEPYLSLFLLRWSVERLGPRAGAAPDIALRHDGARLLVSLARRADAPMEALNELDGVNRLADLLSHEAAARAPGFAELHASAVLVGERLVLFVGPSGSGKSTLALQLAAQGHLLFGDDRLLVGPLDGATPPPGVAQPRGIAFGLTPRVRHPVHPAAGAAFAAFVAAHLVKGGGNVGFLPLPAAAVAPLGQAAPIGALVLPERADTGGVALTQASASSSGRVVLEQMHAPGIGATQFVAAVQRLTGVLPAWHLRYDNSAQAALLVRDMMAR